LRPIPIRTRSLCLYRRFPWHLRQDFEISAGGATADRAADLPDWAGPCRSLDFGQPQKHQEESNDHATFQGGIGRKAIDSIESLKSRERVSVDQIGQKRRVFTPLVRI
jgi:hypothetical protein